MISSKSVTVALVSALVVAGCASSGPPVSNPGQVSGRKHQGEEHEISLRRLLHGDPPKTTSGEPVVGDPDYQEYLEWKRWQEFKEYQKWKQEQDQQAGQAPADGTPAEGSSASGGS
jgi:hypothetical protein